MYLLVKGIVQLHDLDPLGRHSPANTRPMFLLSRYSTITVNLPFPPSSSLKFPDNRAYCFTFNLFQSRPATMCVQMILLAESTRLQQILATYGIRTQTPVELEPLKVDKLNSTIVTLPNSSSSSFSSGPQQPSSRLPSLWVTTNVSS